MADMDDEEQAQADLLNWMQMEALGIKRREKITTADFKENRDYTSVSQLENMRKAIGSDYEPAKQGKSKIVGWKNVYRTIQDDGTLAPGDLRSVNEGLGQTHRAKLMDDDTVRTYTGEPDHHKAVFHRKAMKANIAPTRVTRGRILKGSPTPVATLEGYPSHATTPNRHPSPATTISQVPPLADSQAWLASIQSVKKAAPKAIKQPTPKETPAAIKQPTLEAATGAIKQPILKDASVSVAFLMSLGVNFTQEQLRALTAHAQEGTPVVKTSVANNQNITKPPAAQDKIVVNAVKAFVADDRKVVESPTAQDQIVANAGEISSANDQTGSSPPAAQDQSAKNVVDMSAVHADNDRPTITISRSDMLRRQRDMIIGSQVYKNRYSHAAGSLVESFRRMTLTDPSPVPTPTTQAQPTARNNAMTLPALSAPKDAVTAPPPSAPNSAAAAPALGPRFIPDAPAPVVTVTPPAPLAPMTVNHPLAVNNPFGPARRSRSGGVSLPPHLMGTVASSDHGAAARAQYGTK